MIINTVNSFVVFLCRIWLYSITAYWNEGKSSYQNEGVFSAEVSGPKSHTPPAKAWLSVMNRLQLCSNAAVNTGGEQGVRILDLSFSTSQCSMMVSMFAIQPQVETLRGEGIF